MKTQLATLCYLKKDSRTLMLHRIKKRGDVHAGKWNGLGGKFMDGETPEACVIREVMEESGLTLKNPPLRGVIMFPEFTPETDWMVFVFTATEFEGSLKESEEGHLKWIEDSKLLKLPLWEGDPLFLKWLESPRFFSAKIVYKDKRLVDHQVTFHS